MHAAKTMTAALVTVARIHPLPSFSSECNGQAETQVQTTATGGAAPTVGSGDPRVRGRSGGGRPAPRRRNRASRARRPSAGGAGRAAGALPGGGRAVRRRGLFTCRDCGDPGRGVGDRAIGCVSRPAQAAGAVGRLEGGPVRQEPLWSPDHPDAALGDALWAALTAREDTAEFVTHVLARAEAAGVGTWRAVLGRWSRLAIAAAVALAFLGRYLAGRERAVATSVHTLWETCVTGSEAA